MMKRGFGKLALVLAAACTAGLLTGCSASSPGSSASSGEGNRANTEAGIAYQEDSYEQGAVNNAALSEESKAENGESPAAEPAGTQTSTKKLIKTVNMSVETKEFDKLMNGLTAQVEQRGGYIENLDTYNGSIYSGYRSYRNASLTIRIPREALDDFLKNITETSNVVNRSEREEDVTLTYVDLQSHRDSLKTEYTRLLELMEKAETIEDIIRLEERLSQIRYQMDSMESQLRTFDNKVDYSTVNLNIEEVQVLTPPEEEDLWGRISSGFLTSLKNIGNGVKEFAVWLLVMSPYLIIWAIVILVVVMIIRSVIKKSNSKSMRYTSNVPDSQYQPENHSEAIQEQAGLKETRPEEKKQEEKKQEEKKQEELKQEETK